MIVVKSEQLLAMLQAACADKKVDEPVFTRDNGVPIRDFRAAWSNMCVRASLDRWERSGCRAAIEAGVKKCRRCSGCQKYVGQILHDMRRIAAIRLRSAGVEQSVIMKIGGWKTDSIFRRYAIVDPNALEYAAYKVEQS